MDAEELSHLNEMQPPDSSRYPSHKDNLSQDT